MTTEHDEALVERVALAMCKWKYGIGWDTSPAFNRAYWLEAARAVIYPPAPPKTRLEVARELVSNQYSTSPDSQKSILSGSWDTDRYMRAVLAALALPAMED